MDCFFGLNHRKLIHTKDLSIAYGSLEIKFPDINLNKGEDLLILGKSGSGKTSLLNLIGGISSPKSGMVIINNQNISEINKKNLDLYRGKNIGFVFQTPNFINSLDVKNNLYLTQYLVGIKDYLHINSLLKTVGLINRKNDYINFLSEGEKQRISIVRALVNKPKIILADEPTSFLDDQSCVNVINLLKKLSKENNSNLLIVTHDKRLKDNFNKFIDLDVS